MKRLLTRSATTRPGTANEAERTVELTIATSDVIDGLSLDCSPGAVSWSTAPVPVLLDHTNATGAMAGRLESIRALGSEVVAVARFMDAPAADAGWLLARGGCAVSVGAAIDWDAVQRTPSGEVARRWRLAETSLVPVGADMAATTRSLQTEIETMTSNTETAAAVADEQRSAKELRLERDILRMATAGQLTEAQTTEALTCRSLSDASALVVRMVRERTEAAAPVVAGGGVIAGPVFGNSEAAGQSLEDALVARLQRKGSISTRELCEAIVGRQGSPQELLTRAMSTSDFPALFAGSGARYLREQYEQTPVGLRAIARRRESSDLRDIRLLGLSEFPELQRLTEGGEIKYGAFQDRGGSYRVEEFARGVQMTRRAFLSDDLSAFEEALSAYGRAIAFLEDSLAKDALEAGGTGALVLEDGLALFHANHANTATGTGLSLTTLADALAKFRNATAAGMNAKLNLTPSWLIVPAAAEVTARQLVTQLTPAQTSNVNPFAGGQPLALQVLVDANLSGNHAFLTVDPSDPAVALEITTGPAVAQVDSEADFDTTSLKTRVLADRGLGVRDYRGVVRISLA